MLLFKHRLCRNQTSLITLIITFKHHLAHTMKSRNSHAEKTLYSSASAVEPIVIGLTQRQKILPLKSLATTLTVASSDLKEASVLTKL